MLEGNAKSAGAAANPFTPIFGKVPAYLAGREEIVSQLVTAFDADAPNDPNLCSLFVGPRGSGKTSLLTYLGNEAQRCGWIAVHTTAQAGMLDDILQRAADACAHLVDVSPAKKLTGVSLASVGSLTWNDEPSPQLNWRSRMNRLIDDLAAQDVGIVITVDEINPSLQEMQVLATTYQHFVREGRKAAFLMAGLPHNISRLLSGETTSFLRRAAHHHLGPIPSYEVKEAFRLTVEAGGKTIESSALDEACEAIGGFPYMFQLVGYRAWNASAREACVSSEHVREGAKLAQEELESRVFDATLAGLSEGDLDFVRALASTGESASRIDVAARLKKSSSHVSTYKRRLLEAGVIEEPRRGVFTFALPGFGNYVRRLYDIGSE